MQRSKNTSYHDSSGGMTGCKPHRYPAYHVYPTSNDTLSRKRVSALPSEHTAYCTQYRQPFHVGDAYAGNGGLVREREVLV